MRGKLLHLWSRLRSSYWFVPTLMAAGAVVLSLATIEVDRRWGDGLHLAWISLDQASARAFLTTVAGSMITVAGVAFSITMVALTLASSQFGPRLLENFMRDRGNQVVLGTFIATFLYCLLVLRVLKLGESGTVPEVALSTALLLTLGSLAVFIYFIHHAAMSIQVQTLVAHVAAELETSLDRLLEDAEEERGERGEAERRLVGRVAAEGATVCADDSGYVDEVEAARLEGLAADHGLVVVCVQKPGQFVVAGTPLLHVLRVDGDGGSAGGGDGDRAGAGAADLGDDGELAGKLRRAVPLTGRRRPGNVEFIVSQLVEVAVRALSPGINDPFTAINCIDLLGAALARFARRPPPRPVRRDDAGRLRVVLPDVGLEELLDAAYDQIRQYGRGCVPVTLRLLERLADLASRAAPGADRDAVLRHAEMVRRSGVEALPEPYDRQAVEERYRWVLAAAA